MFVKMNCSERALGMVAAKLVKNLREMCTYM